ncbi:MAG TPA: hypothetical protein VIV06_10825 [Candidatus Limnocylindrales bacterium]
MSRLRDIQYHVVQYAPDGNGGPGSPVRELTPHVLNLVWQQVLNGAGQMAFSLARFNEALAGIDWMRDHVKVFRVCRHGERCVFAGKLIRPDEGSRDAIVYAWDYPAFLQRSRTGFKVLYPDKTIKEIVDAEWALAKNASDSPFAFVATGTTQAPVGMDGTTEIKVNSQFGVIDFDRLFTFYSLAEMAMANTANTVVFEITREAPHTFNFWKNRSTARSTYAFTYPGTLIDYQADPGYDELQNDIATVLTDPATGAQSEYVVSDPVSIAAFRRLQSAVAIKTLYGVTTGTTENDQQKAAAARILTQSVVVPKVITLYPRQHELDPFLNPDGSSWDLGDTFRTTIRDARRSADEYDLGLAITAIAGAWTPDAGELIQAHGR